MKIDMKREYRDDMWEILAKGFNCIVVTMFVTLIVGFFHISFLLNIIKFVILFEIVFFLLVAGRFFVCDILQRIMRKRHGNEN